MFKSKLTSQNYKFLKDITKSVKENKSLLNLFKTDLNDESIIETIENLVPYLEIVADALSAIVQQVEDREREERERAILEHKERTKKLTADVSALPKVKPPKHFSYETQKKQEIS